MKLLENFTAPDVTQIVYHSLTAQQTWEPRINRMGAEHTLAERKSVLEGIRDACLQSVDSRLEYAQLEAFARNNDLYLYPLKAVGRFSGFADSYPAGDDIFVALLTRDRDAIEAFVEAEREYASGRPSGDVWSAAAAFLGYPECCISPLMNISRFIKTRCGSGRSEAGKKSVQVYTYPPYRLMRTRYFAIIQSDSHFTSPARRIVKGLLPSANRCARL
jgi:hypothetical protein